MAKDEQRLNNGIRDKAPCAYCEDDVDKPICHDTCKRYLEWRARLEANKEARKAYNRLRRETWRRMIT